MHFRQPTSKYYRIPAILLLAVYLLVTGTLDLHHNHGSIECVGCPSDDASAANIPVTSWSASHDADHDPCPVLRYTMSHAPLVALDATVALVPQLTDPAPEFVEAGFQSCHLPSPRAPPVV